MTTPHPTEPAEGPRDDDYMGETSDDTVEKGDSVIDAPATPGGEDIVTLDGERHQYDGPDRDPE